MLVYIVALALVGAIGVLDYRLRKSTDISRAAYALIFLTLASVMGLRSASVGIDTYSYSQYFTRIVQSSDPEHYMNIVSAAPIYSIYNKILGMVSDNPQILILVSSLVICSGVLFFIFTFSRNAVLSVFLFVALYFYIDCFNGMRQGLAMTLALVAYALLFKGKRVPAILFYVCAIGTHATALIMAPFYILLLFDFSTRRFKCIAAAIMVASVMFALFSEQLVALFIRSFGYSQYLDLFTSEAYQTTGKNILRSIFYAAILVLFFAKISAHRKTEDPFLDLDRAIFFPALFGVCLALTFYYNYLIGARIASYLTIFMIIAMANCARYLKQSRILYLITICSASVILFVLLLSGNYSGVVPYEAFWSMQ